MPKPINETIGRCRCRKSGCAEVADVRRMKNHERGALYLVCPRHGTDKAPAARFQPELDQWIADNTPEPQEGPEPGPEPAPAPPPAVPEPAPQEGPAPGRRRAGFFAWLNDWRL